MTTSTWRNAGDGQPPQEPRQPGGASPRVVAGRYRLDETIGRGAMGIVWLARDELLDRNVAVKEVRLPPSLSETERDNSYQRTLREARTAARLSHPAVAAVYDVVEESGRPWIVMELVPGRSLDRVITEDGPMAPRRAADVGRQVLAALSAAHRAGVMHRDVKPSNVLITHDGRTVLTDFGIAMVEGDPSLTQTGVVMGSPGFLAPERIRGGVATPASDLWSLGATLYAAVEGQGPYDSRGGAMTTMAAVVTEDPQPPKAAGPLLAVINALLSRDPAQRPSIAAARQMLELIAAGGAAADIGAAAGQTATSRVAGTPGGAAAGANAAASGQDGADLPPRTLPAGPAAAAGQASGPGRTAPGQPWLPATPRPATIMPPAAVPASYGGSAAAAALPSVAQRSYAGTTSAAAAATASRGSAPGQARLGPAAIGPASIGPARASHARVPGYPGGAAHARRPSGSGRVYRVITFVIIGGVIFVAAGLAAAELQKAKSERARSTPPPTGTGQSAAPSAAAPGAVIAGAGASVRLPGGFRWFTQRVGIAGIGTAGFRIAVPSGWHAKRNGMQTLIEEPSGHRFLEVDLTPHTHPVMLAEVRYLQSQTLIQGTFPGYRAISVRAVRYQGTLAADWAFTWQNQTSGPTEVLDRAFMMRSPTGSQSYAIYWSTPTAQWLPSRSMLAEVLSSFQPIWP